MTPEETTTNPGDAPGDAATTPLDVPPADEITQGSSLGVLAMLLALFGVLGCAVSSVLSVVLIPQTLFAIPVTALCSVLGLVLGVVSLVRSKRGPDGRARGRAPAGIGAFVGAAGSAIQVFAIVSALGVFFPIKQRVVPVMEQLTAHVNADDFDAGYALLGETARASIAPEQFESFWAEFEFAVGEIQGVRFELATLSRNAASVSSLTPNQDPDAAYTAELPRPIEIQTGQQGYVFVGLWLDKAGLDQNLVLIDDMIGFLPNGSLLLLRTDGPASEFAGAFVAPVVVP